MKKESLDKILEGVLFVYGDPMTIKKLSELTKKSIPEIKDSLARLAERLEETSGLRLIIKDKRAQLVSDGRFAALIEKLFKKERKEELTRAALEVLAIIAYNEDPVSRADIETIRGVNSAYIVRHLTLRGLIEKSVMARGVTPRYELSFESLRKFGLKNQSQLPSWQEIQEDIEKAKNALNETNA